MTHYYPVEIFYEDTDAAGIVYHANYLKYMERARTTFLLEKGLRLPSLLETQGIQFVVRSVTIRYEKPVRLQQRFIVATDIVKYNKASMVFSQNSYFDPSNEQTMICSGEVVIVCTNVNLKPCAIPAAIVKELID